MEGVHGKVILLDGGLSSQLSRHVKGQMDGHPLWTCRFLVEDPDAVYMAHLEFLEAGSEVVSTNTYQANGNLFMDHLGISMEEAMDMIKKAVHIAQKARDKFMEKVGRKIKPQIVGAVGPYGAFTKKGDEYRGTYADTTTLEELKEWHRPRVQTLIEAGVDLLAFETVPCQVEAEALVSLLKEFPNAKAWLSFSCKDGKSISHGENFQEAARHCYDLNPTQIVAVGVNCLSPTLVEVLFDGINEGRVANPVPLICYPNSGEVYDDGKWSGQPLCKPIETFIPKWMDLGVKYIGGCCRTYAENIAIMRKEIAKLEGSF